MNGIKERFFLKMKHFITCLVVTFTEESDHSAAKAEVAKKAQTRAKLLMTAILQMHLSSQC